MNPTPVHVRAFISVSELLTFRIVSIFILALFLVGNSIIVKAGTTERVTIASDGVEGDRGGSGAVITPDGRYVAFSSSSTNLVPGDSNGFGDVFIHDRVTGVTELVSISNDGVQGNHQSDFSSISNDGRFVTFLSFANNLISNEAGTIRNVFVRDRLTGIVTYVSLSSDGAKGNNHSRNSSMTGDGRYVAFTSLAANLISDDTNGVDDVFVHDRVTGITERVSIDNFGNQFNNRSLTVSSSSAATISADGRYIVFTNQGNILVRDRIAHTTENIGTGAFGTISADGRYIAYDYTTSRHSPPFTELITEVFVYDRINKTTQRVSIASDGTETNRGSYSPSISADGNYVTFASVATNLVPNDTNEFSDAFVHDRISGNTERISVSSNGGQGNGSSFPSFISADGRSVVFQSIATNLVPNDTNSAIDVFVHDRQEENIAPIASIGPDQTVSANTVVQLDGNASTDPEGDYPLTYAWTITQKPAGSAAVLSDSTSAIPTFTTDVLGDYVVELVVTDSKGKNSAPDTVIISTVNSSPTAAITATPISVTVHGTTVLLDGSGSTDPDGDTLTFGWTLTPPAGSATTLVNPAEIMPSFMPDVHGNYVVELIVTDSHGASSVPVSVIVTFDNLPPVASATYAEAGQVLIEGNTINLSGSGTDANLDTVSSYTWTLTTPAGSTATLSNVNAQNPNFVADIAGDYTLSLVVQDEHGLDSVSFTLGPITVITQAQAIDDAFNVLLIGFTSLDPAVFNKPKQQNKLIKRLGAVSKSINKGKYKQALKRLQKKVLRRTDGCNGDPNGTPDGNDWLDCSAQAVIFPLVNNLIYFLSQ